MNRTLIGFLKKEFVQALRDPRMRLMIFAVPLIQLTLFGVALSNEVKNIRLGSIYSPPDRLAQRIEKDAFASGWFLPADGRGVRSLAGDAFGWVQSGLADAVMVAPAEGLERAIEHGNGRLQLLVNAANVVRAQSIESYFQSVVNRALREEMGVSVSMPIEFDVRVLYNPTMETSAFMVPGVMCMILGVITIILTSMSLAKEKEMGTFEMLIAAPVKTWEILAGKSLPYVVLGMIDAPLILGVAVWGFGVPLKGSVLLFLLATLMFLVSTVSIGVLISTFSRNQQQGMMGGFLFLFPSIMLSGMMFPVENMPLAIRWLAYLDPIQYYVALLRNIMLKGGELSVVLLNMGLLFLMAALTAGLSFRRFRHTL